MDLTGYMRLGKANRLAFKVALIYVSVTVSWNIFSDRVLQTYLSKANAFYFTDILKDCGLAVITGGLIYWLLKRSLRRWELGLEKSAQAEAVLAQSNSLLNAALESTADGILVVDALGKVTSCNQKFLQLWQIPAALAAGRDDQRLLQYVIGQLAEPDLFQAKVQELYHHPQAESWDELKFRDGRIFERYSKAQRIGDSVVGRVWSFRDITKRKQAEAKLLESEDRFRSMIENSSLGIYVNLDMKFAYVNSAALRLLGAERPDQLLGQPFLTRVHPDYHECIRERVAKVFLQQQNAAPALEEIYLRLDGTSVPVEVTATPIRYQGQPGSLVFLQDITERKLAEAQTRALARLSSQLSVATDNQVAAEAVTDTALELFAWDACFLFRYDATSDTFRELVNKDTLNGERVTVPLAPDSIHPSPMLRRVIEQGGQLVLRKADTDDAGTIRRFGDTSRISLSLMYVPLKLHGKVVGFLSVQSYRRNAYTQQDLATLQSLADHCAGAIARIDAETALRASEARYALTERAVADGMWDWNILTDEDVFSPRWKAILGYRDDELTNHKSTFLNLIHPDDRAKVNEATRGHLEAGKPYALEIRLRHKDGSYRWLFSRGEAMRDAEGRPVRMFGATTDITERKQAETALKTMALRHQKLLQTGTDGIHVLDLRGNVVEANSAFATMLGYSLEEVMQLNVADWDVRWSREQLMVKIAELIARPEVFETRHRCKDGTFITVEISASAVVLEGCHFLYNSARDITARKAAEAALQLSEFSVNHASLATLWIARDARIVRANAAACAQLGYTEAELLQLAITNLDPDFPAARWLEHWQDLRTRKRMCFETRHRRKDGHLIPVEVDLNWFEFGGQEYNFAFMRDITERKQAEARIHRLNRTHAVLSEINQTIVREHEPQALFTAACAIGVETGKFRMAWIGIINRTTQQLEPVASAGVVEGYLQLTQIDLQDTTRKSGPAGRCCSTGEHSVCNLIELDASYLPWREEALKRGYQSSAGFPLKMNGEVIGVFSFYAGEPEFFDSDELRLLDDLAADISFALEVHDSQARYQVIFENAPDAVFLISAEGEDPGSILACNRLAAQMHGYQPGELIGKNIAVLNIDESAARVPERLRRMTAGEPLTFEVQHRRQDGSIFPVEVTTTQITVAGQKCVIAFDRDITERRLAEEAHARLAMLVEQATESIVITDAKGKITYVNPAFEKASGYTAAEALGHNPRLLKSGQHDTEFYRKLWEVLLAGHVWSGHFVNRRKDGKLYEEDATISPIRDATGKVINYMAVKRDTTREAQLENQLRQSQKMEAIGQLAGGVAHDFNNILASTLMQVELLTGEPTAVEIREGLEQIRADANRAANLTRQLLLFSRRQVMQPRVLDLNELITNLVKMLQRIIGEHVQMQLNLHPAELLTRADAGMLDQVLMNLVVNARDAMPHGGQLRIETTAKTVDADTAQLHAEAAPGHFVCFSVSDNGGGIPPEILPRVFEPFFTTKGEGKGTGLGLATVYGIVKQHHGWVQLVNRPAQGVTFQIFLPANATPTEAGSSDTQFKTRRGTETILLVEDESGLLKLARKILERQGYRVWAATNGQEALKLWQTHHATVALLLTDMVMPGGMNGQELARQMQAEKPGLKVVFMSGYSATIAGHEFQLKNGETFIQKPFAVDQLLKMVRTILEGQYS